MSPGGERERVQRWRRWAPLLARSLISARRWVAVRSRALRLSLPQLVPSCSQQYQSQPVREADAGMLGCLSNQLIVFGE